MLRSADFIFRPPVPEDAPAWAAAVRESTVTLAPWMPWAHAAYTEGDALGWGRVEITVALGNAASLGAARKAGAFEEGIARNRLRLGDRFVDAHVLSLVPAGTDRKENT